MLYYPTLSIEIDLTSVEACGRGIAVEFSSRTFLCAGGSPKQNSEASPRISKKRSANIDLHSGPLIASSRTLGPRAYKRPVVEQGALEALNPVWGLAGLKVCLALLTAKDSLKP